MASLLLFEVGDLELDALDLLSCVADLGQADFHTDDGLFWFQRGDFHFFGEPGRLLPVSPLDPVGDYIALFIDVLYLAQNKAILAQEFNFDVSSELLLTIVLGSC